MSLTLSESPKTCFVTPRPISLQTMEEEISMINLNLDFLLTVKAATLIFISGCGSAISSAKVGKSAVSSGFPLFANVCPNLPDVRSYPTLP